MTATRRNAATSILLAVALAASPGAASEAFDRDFEPATLRLDLYHGGDASSNRFILDRASRQDGWSGPTTALLDPLPYGAYRVVVRDAGDGRVLFERGFDSLFGEYRTTAPAGRGEPRMFHESVLVPFPRRAVRVALQRHAPGVAPESLAELEIDPGSFDIALEPPPTDVRIVPVHGGDRPSAEVVDLTFVGEGYTAAEAALFEADLRRFAALLLDQEPFAAFRDRLAIRGVLAASADSGCDEPRRRRYRSTPLEASFNSLGSERYLLVNDNRTLRDLTCTVPTDAIVVMVNHHRYGGGGLYNQYCAFTAHNEWSGYLLLHELGHSFAGLGDEYYTSSVAYTGMNPPDVEPEAPNVTALLEPGRLKWRDLVASGTPLPTPWRKDAYDAFDIAAQERRRVLEDRVAEAVRRHAPAAEVAKLEEEAARHAREHAAEAAERLAADPAAGLVGAFEGAGYEAVGLFRPTLDCIMFSRGVKPYCPVCRRAVAKMIDSLTDAPSSAAGIP